MEEAESRRRFAASRVARLATVRTDGSPHLVPVVFALHGDVLYSVVDPKPKTSRALQRLENVRAEPRVSLLVDEYDEEWRRLWWVRADGIARVVDSGPEHDTAVRLLREKYQQYDAGDASFGDAIVIRIVRWRSWSYVGSVTAPQPRS